MITVKITNLKVVKQKTHQVTGRAPRDRVPMQAAVDMAKKEVLSKVPVDRGILRDSISTDVNIGLRNSVTGHVVASASHAPYVELGTSKMPPQPFMRPAIQGSNKRRIVERYRKSLAARMRTY